jgi:hypothetical protein
VSHKKAVRPLANPTIIEAHSTSSPSISVLLNN